MINGFINPTHGNGTNKKSIAERKKRLRLFENQQGQCHWCKGQMELTPLTVTINGNVKDNKRFATFEHLLPKSAGGKNNPENIVLAHAACNNKRHIRKWPHDPFYKRLNKPCSEVKVDALS